MWAPKLKGLWGYICTCLQGRRFQHCLATQKHRRESYRWKTLDLNSFKDDRDDFAKGRSYPLWQAIQNTARCLCHFKTSTSERPSNYWPFVKMGICNPRRAPLHCERRAEIWAKPSIKGLMVVSRNLFTKRAYQSTLDMGSNSIWF
jgi:hypothetical protein